VTPFSTLDLNGITVIEATGRLDALASPQLDESIKAVNAAGQSKLVIDMGQVAYMSSSCLRVLLMGARRAREQGGDLKLCCLPPRVRQVLALAGFDLVFQLADSREGAVAAFAAPSHGAERPCLGA
jgi:anti-sigma B factor antagonist